MQFQAEYVFEEPKRREDLVKMKKNLQKEGIKMIWKKNKILIFSEDFFKLTLASNVIEAFLAGFDPSDAIKLMDENYSFHKIDVKDYAGKKKNHIRRLKGRVIGEKGKTMKYIEKITNSKIIVKDRYVYILGDIENSEIAKETVERLLKGSPHSSAYKYMESRKRELRKRKILEEFQRI